MTTTNSPSPLRQILLVAFGNARVTKSACRRARSLVGPTGTVAVSSGSPAADKVVERLGSAADLVASRDATSLLELLTQLTDEPLLVLHDDASIEPDDFVILAKQHRGVLERLVGAEDTGEATCVLGRPSQIADRLSDASHFALLDGPALPPLQSGVRHEGRCGVAAAAEPAPRVPLVVASMIMRDEAYHIADCLHSVRDFADHVVICDTGSTDASVDIARRLGATVIAREWCDDFGWARNEALGAIDAGDWVLWIDADERLRCPDPAAARLALRQIDADVRALGITVESGRDDGPSSTGVAQRLFRRLGATFTGALHETVVDDSAHTPLPTDMSDLVTIDHLGYQGGASARAQKASRNLAIAQTAYDIAPTMKTATDLARSIAYAGGDLRRATAVALQHLDIGEGTPTPQQLHLASMVAGFQLDLGDWDAAYELSHQVLVESPTDDVAAAVFASSGRELGRNEEVVSVLDRELGADTSTLRVPVNRIVAWSVAAVAATNINDQPAAQRCIARAVRLAPSVEGGWSAIAEALGTLDPMVATNLVSDIEPGARRALGNTNTSFHPEVAAALAAAPADMGITLDFDAGALSAPSPQGGASQAAETAPPTVVALASAVPLQRRVVEWSGDEELTRLLGDQATDHITLDPQADLIQQLQTLVAEDACFDVAIGGLESRQIDEVLGLLKELLDPAGSCLLWDLGPSSTPAGGVAPALHGPDRDVRLAQAGFHTDPIAPQGTVRLRPAVDAELKIGGFTPASSRAHVSIVTDGRLGDELRLAYRISIPGNIALTFDECDPDPAADAVLVTNSTILPEPRWVQYTLDWVLEHNEPAGARVVDQQGNGIHAGLDDRGQFVGFGDRADAPLLQSDRPATPLAVPYAVPGQHHIEEPSGRLIGSAVALEVGAERIASPADLADLFQHPVVLLDGPAPGCGAPHERAAIDKAIWRLCELGFTPLYQYAETTESIDAHIAQEWRRRGCIVIGPSPDGVATGSFRPDIATPRADALVTALQPEAVVYLSGRSLQWDFERIAGQAPAARVIYAGPANDLAEGRTDVCCSITELTDVLTATPRVAAGPGERKVPTIVPISTVPGRTSIVIPVHNRWDLTQACLASIEAHTPSDHDIIVVDNGSTDATPAGLRDSPVSVITNSENRGFPIAVNQGIAAAAGEFVCVLNNDTVVTPGWLDHQLAALAVANTGMVGPRSNRIAGLQGIPDSPAADDDDIAAWAEGILGSERAAPWPISRLIGFCLVLRRSTLEELGGFDEGFGIGNYEDDELGNRIQASGRTLRVADDALVIHHGSATFREIGLDYAAVMHHASRHQQGATAGVNALTVVVLSDGDSIGAASSAASALVLTEQVRVVERRALLSTELACAALRGAELTVTHTDWTSEDGAQAALEGLQSDMVLVLAAGELIECADWAHARAELDAVPNRPTGIHNTEGGEIRLVPCSPDAIDEVGAPAKRWVESFTLGAMAPS